MHFPLFVLHGTEVAKGLTYNTEDCSCKTPGISILILTTLSVATHLLNFKESVELAEAFCSNNVIHEVYSDHWTACHFKIQWLRHSFPLFYQINPAL